MMNSDEQNNGAFLIFNQTEIPRANGKRQPFQDTLLATGRQRRDRGMILLLVIALLVLLALMGSVFILMASTDKQSAYASNSSASLTMAQEGVLNTVRGMMLNETLDSENQTLAIGSISGKKSTFSPTTPQIARFWDYPEVGAMSSTAPASAPQFYQSVTVGTQPTPTQYAPSEPWLVNNQPYEPNSYYVPGEEVYYLGSRYVYTGSANVVAGLPGTGNWSLASTPSTGYASATGSNTTTGAMPLFSTLTPLLYDPATSAYDLTWSVGGSASATNIVVPNASVVEPRWTYNPITTSPGPYSNGLQPTGTPDAMWNMLPYSDPNGTRYRFAVRIMDMSSFLNLNTGWIPSTDAGGNADGYLAQYGPYIDACPILSSAVNANTSDTPANAQSGTSAAAGREGSYVNYSSYGYTLYNWQAGLAAAAGIGGLNDYEQDYPTVASPTTQYNLSLFGANSELDLLTAGGAGGMPFGSPFYSRLATLMPNTLGLESSYYGSGYRGLYTTDSWTRDVAPVNIWTAFSLAPPIPVTSAPPKINLNTPFTSANISTEMSTLENTLITCGYQPLHALMFVVNYLDYRYGTGSGTSGYNPAVLVANGNKGTALLYPPNPSAITSIGTWPMTINIPSIDSASTNPVTPALPNVEIVGNSAQPFLNAAEVAVQTDSKGNKTQIVSFGVDLMNPFASASNKLISFGNGTPADDWQLVVPGVGSIDLYTAFPNGIPAYQSSSPASSIITIIGNSGSGNITINSGNINTPYSTSYTAGAMSTSGIIELERPDPGNPGSYVEVDEIQYDFSSVKPTSGQTLYSALMRDNTTQWGCDSAWDTPSPTPLTPSTTDPEILGIPNPSTNTLGQPGYDSGPMPGIPLYDRFYSGYNSTAFPFLANATIDSNDDLININDFNCIARKASFSTPSGSGIPLTYTIGTDDKTPATYVPSTSTAAEPIFSGESNQANIYFDFAYDPRAALTAANAALDTTGIPPTILSMTTLTDRSSNSAAFTASTSNNVTTTLPEGPTDLLRLPGKVNINTAGPDVLCSVFSDDGALWNGTIAPTSNAISLLVDDAMAFRERLPIGSPGPPIVSPVPLFAPNATTTMIPNPNAYNGFSSGTDATGFHSTADFLLASLPTVYTAGALYSGSVAPTNLQQRDAAWADVENFITVRSDTFAVYGLVEGLRLNPNYTSTAYTPTDWYNANQGIAMGSAGSMSTDATNANAEFILEGTRRFIAIIDRSYCNNGNVVQPHIVAVKILPQ